MSAFIAAENESIAARVRDVLNFDGKDCPAANVLTIDQAAGRLGREAGVDLVVVVLPADRERGLATLPTIARAAPGRVLAVGSAADSKLVLRTLRAGAADYVDVGDLEADLEAALGRLAEAEAPPAEPGKLVAVLAPSGGGGSSTVAVNLAAALAKPAGGVALVDMKLEAGDLAAMLDLRPSFSLADLCQNSARLDRTMFDRTLARHESGIHLLSPPPRLGDVGQVGPEGVSLALSLARTGFPLVVADVDHTFREEQAIVLRQADVVLVVFRLEFAPLRNAKRALEFLDSIDVRGDRVRVVVNRHGQPREIPPKKAEEALGRPIDHFLPEDAKAVNHANNNGVPVVLGAPSSKVARSLTRLALAVGLPTKP